LGFAQKVLSAQKSNILLKNSGLTCGHITCGAQQSDRLHALRTHHSAGWSDGTTSSQPPKRGNRECPETPDAGIVPDLPLRPVRRSPGSVYAGRKRGKHGHQERGSNSVSPEAVS
jgi:hypothetical protein